jgi:hypothetical protein
MHLKEVLPYGTVCQVQRKMVNAHGLARLSIRAILPLDDDDHGGENTSSVDDEADTTVSTTHNSRHEHHRSTVASTGAATTTVTAATTSSPLTRRNNSIGSSIGVGERRQRARRLQQQQQHRHSPPCRLVEGWCSQFLNPMSGQGGSVVQPIPFCVPVVYRVTLPEGAVVRQEIELYVSSFLLSRVVGGLDRSPLLILLHLLPLLA